jgi:23S rRNA pseudouridine1911/1915/1917 synthase
LDISRRWVVGPGDGGTVRDVLARADADAGAVSDGRVFIGRRRVKADDERVANGDVVEVSAPHPPSGRAVEVIAKTHDLVGVAKPAGVPTIPDQSGASHSLLAATARSLGVVPADLHPTSRLDREVSGIVIFARTPAAAQRLAQARVDGRYERRYVAVSGAVPEVDHGTWNGPIGRAADPRRRMVGGRGATVAVTHFSVRARASSGAALLAVAPVTGRTHQIRVHASHAGVPLVGDRPYGGLVRVTLPTGRVVEPRRIALHAARVVVPDEHGEPVEMSAPIPPDLAELWSLLGGSDTWEDARSCVLP